MVFGTPGIVLELREPVHAHAVELADQEAVLVHEGFLQQGLGGKKDLDAKKAELTSQQRGTYNYARNILMKPNVGIDAEDDDDSDSEDEDKDVIVIDD